MITEIEDKLNTINEDKFANAARLYLSYRFNNVLSTGFALGQEKSKRGIPDIFIPLQSDYYCFNEITTVQQKHLKAKLLKDITDCFEQKDIPIEKIAQIILICNRKVSSKLYDELANHKSNYSSVTRLEIIGIDDFANHIFRDYPSLCKELGISIDTGQILEVEGFIKQYEKSKFATTLQNQFYNRENEILSALKSLKDGNLLLIYGQAGTGKTKLSLEIVKRFKDENPDFNLKYIINNNQLIWDDLKTQLTINKNYVLVIDDANKLKSNLDLIANFIKEERKGQIKIIFTVRDYVKNEIFDRFFNYQEIELKNFSREELSKILESKEFNITRYGIDKIYSISKGNPRLAIMAATAALNKDYDKLNNAATIFEEYFSSIKNDLELLNDVDLLKVAGILSVYKNIDTNYERHTNTIDNFFSIKYEVLIEKLNLLFQIEVADEFKGIYKISEQILGEYIFYLVFIKNQYIDFFTLLNIFTKESNNYLLMRALSPIVQNFGFEKIKDKLLPSIKKKWDEIKTDDNVAINYLEYFWAYLPTEGLIYVQEQIKDKGQADLNILKFELYKENHIEEYQDKIVDILSYYSQLPEKFGLALELLMKYGLSNQLTFSKILKVFCQSFAYGIYSFQNKYFSQIEFFKFLYKKAESNNLFYSKIILFIADKYLVDGYFSFTNNDNISIITRENSIVLIDEQKEFRRSLWDFIFNCFLVEELKENVYQFLEKYQNTFGSRQVKDVVKFDKELLLPFLVKNFSSKSLRECCIIQSYLRRLKRFKIDYNKDLEQTYRNEEYELWFILNERGLDKDKTLENFLKYYTEKDYIKLLKILNTIFKQRPDDFNGVSIMGHSITRIFIYLSDIDFELFIKILRKYNRFEYSDNILEGLLFSKMNYTDERMSTLRLLIYRGELFKKYLHFFIINIPQNHFLKEDYLQFKKKIAKEENNDLFHIDIVLEKLSQIENIHLQLEINEIINILFSKIHKNEDTYIDDNIFIFLYKKHFNLFKQNIEKIEKVYLFMVKRDKSRHFDYRNNLLKSILNLNPSFIVDVLSLDFDTKTFISRRELTDYNFSSLWDLPNYDEVLVFAFNFLKNAPMFLCNSPCELVCLFSGNSINEERVLKSLIAKSENENELRKIFNIIVSKYNSKKFEYLNLILSKNKSLNLFKKLDFYITDGVIINARSFIPQLRFKISEFEELKGFLESLNDLDLLQHIIWVENTISYHKEKIEEEIKREFLEKWGY